MVRDGTERWIHCKRESAIKSGENEQMSLFHRGTTVWSVSGTQEIPEKPIENGFLPHSILTTGTVFM